MAASLMKRSTGHSTDAAEQAHAAGFPLSEALQDREITRSESGESSLPRGTTYKQSWDVICPSKVYKNCVPIIKKYIYTL